DLDGKRIGSWFVGDELKIESILKKLKLSAELYPQNFNVNDLIEGRADCIATMRYNEYWQLLAGGMDPSELSIFDFKEAELSTLEDGLYILESNLKDPQMRNRIVRFIAATIEGWRYTLDHPQEALEVVLDNDPTGVLDEEHQRRMLQIITTLLHPNRDKIGLLDEQRYQQTVNLLRQSNILKSAPLGFYTTELWSEAIELLR
ncbi:MAG TPA: ABC transporter substrate-binding protein, partial [Gammaproteobacteria bacterium]|nr:ABC transporter substrate-binding protein [Gammaproteobacteria bacterium]